MFGEGVCPGVYVLIPSIMHVNLGLGFPKPSNFYSIKIGKVPKAPSPNYTSGFINLPSVIESELSKVF